MNFDDLLAELPKLTAQQRDEILWRVGLLKRMADPAFIDRITRLNDEIGVGGLSRAQVRAMLAERGCNAVRMANFNS